MSDFTLHPQLARDSLLVGELDLCQVRLINDSQFPWVILVPMMEQVQEIYQLDNCLQAQFWRESKWLSSLMMGLYKGDKLNVAAIGNMVPQLHVHHIVRYKSDPLWPQPVWGKLAMQAYSEQQAQQEITRLREGLEEHGLQYH